MIARLKDKIKNSKFIENTIKYLLKDTNSPQNNKSGVSNITQPNENSLSNQKNRNINS